MPNRLLLTYLEEKPYIEKMKTLNQIGRAALSRLLNSDRFRPPGDLIKFDLEFSSDVCDIERRFWFDGANDGLLPDEGNDYMFWGIEWGLQRVAVLDEGYSLAEWVVRQVTHPYGPLPSHMVVKYWRDDGPHTGEISYKVYRLSDKQDKQLRSMRDGKFPST